MEEDKGNAEDCFLSDHTLSMREALAFCIDQLKHMPLQQPQTDHQNSVRNTRPQSKSPPPLQLSHIDILRQMPCPSQFRQEYVRTNRPCLIQDPVWANQYFGNVLHVWGGSAEERRQWFVTRWGEEHRVPVKRAPSPEVDEYGRALECETEYVTLTEWFNKLDASSAESYLKDWHLQKHLETTANDNEEEPLYRTPPHFECDLLNQKLLQFTKGDYRFTYWGPDGSHTGRHTDVLNSFSWSFNVVGVKEWTFYTPDPVKLLQHAGECVFVPAMLPHTVRNVGETLSVNHNWITSSNLNLVWQCIQDEIELVGTELNEWNKSTPDLNYDWDAKESMLRGCLGLDVTAFFFMILVGIVKALPENRSHGYTLSDRDFDLIRLGDMLFDLVMDQGLHLKARLDASLADATLATSALEAAKKALSLIEKIRLSSSQ